jgi:hypothetical protein
MSLLLRRLGPRRGGGVAVAMVRCRSADRCSGRMVGHALLPMSGRINVGVGLFLPPDYARAAASSYSVFIALQTRPHRMIADGFCGAATMHNRWLAVRLSAKRAQPLQ